MTTLKTKELKNAVKILSTVVQLRATMPICECVQIDLATDGSAVLMGTDLDTRVSLRLDGGGERVCAYLPERAHDKIAQSLCVKLSALKTALKSSGADTELKIDGLKLLINGLEIVGVSSDEMPSAFVPNANNMSATGRAISFPLNDKTRKDLADCLITASQDQARFNMVAVAINIRVTGKDVETPEMIATDGHRLTLRVIEEASFDAPKKLLGKGKKLVAVDYRAHIIPKITAKLLTLLPDGKISISAQGLLAYWSEKPNSTIVSARMIDGDFPSYEQVLPKGKMNTVIGLDRDQSLAAFDKVVGIVKNDKQYSTKIELTKERITISATDAETGSCSTSFNGFDADKPLTFGVNAKYVGDFLRTLPKRSKFVMQLTDDLGPIKFLRAANDSGQVVIMPMRLK